jgi:hypothetical protein
MVFIIISRVPARVEPIQPINCSGRVDVFLNKFTISFAILPMKVSPEDLAILNQIFSGMVVEKQILHCTDVDKNSEDMCITPTPWLDEVNMSISARI